MRISDYIEQSLSNLRKKKLRTFLTTFGVVIGIGALISMFSFGKGVQQNVTDNFKKMGLFNYIAVYPFSGSHRAEQAMDPDDPHTQTLNEELPESVNAPILDVNFLKEVREIKGVESAFPEIRFPAQIKLREKERFSLFQVMSDDVCQTELMKLRSGKAYEGDNENSTIINDVLLRRMDIKDFDAIIGEEIEIFTLAIDGLEEHTSQGSGILCMAIVGGAIIPLLMGYVSDIMGYHHAFIITLACYAYIFYYAIKGYKH